MTKKLLLAALFALALGALAFVLLHDWDEPSPDPRSMGGPHLGTPRPSAAPSASVTVTFDPNGGSVDEGKTTVKRGETVSLDKGASRPGWTFLGWFPEKASGERLQTVKPEEDTTVYAHWRQTPVPATLNGGDHGAYVVGYGDGTVRPTNPITRAEYAAICSRFDKSETLDLSDFTDIQGHWAASAIKHAVSIGWVRGYADHTFRPNQQITRAESMTLTNRVLQRLPASPSDLQSGMKTFTDNADSAAWADLPPDRENMMLDGLSTDLTLRYGKERFRIFYESRLPDGASDVLREFTDCLRQWAVADRLTERYTEKR